MLELKQKTKQFIYEAKRGAPFNNKQAQIFGEELAKLCQNEVLEGLQPEKIVQYAKDKHSPLHDYFTWNNGEAGDNWRIFQARQLCNHIVTRIIIVKEIETVTVIPVTSDEENAIIVRAFPNIISEGKHIYMPIEEVMYDEEKRQQLIEQALTEAERWKAKWKIYTELDEIFEAIDQTKKRIVL